MNNWIKKHLYISISLTGAVMVTTAIILKTHDPVLSLGVIGLFTLIFPPLVLLSKMLSVQGEL